MRLKTYCETIFLQCLTHENCNFHLESLSPVHRKCSKRITLKVNDVTEAVHSEQEEVTRTEEDCPSFFQLLYGIRASHYELK